MAGVQMLQIGNQFFDEKAYRTKSGFVRGGRGSLCKLCQLGRNLARNFTAR